MEEAKIKMKLACFLSIDYWCSHFIIVFFFFHFFLSIIVKINDLKEEIVWSFNMDTFEEDLYLLNNF